MVRNTSNSQVHLSKAVSCWVTFLTINIYGLDITSLCFYIFCTLNEHSTRSTARIVKSTIEWLNEGSNQLHNVVWGIELSIFLCRIYGKRLQEVLVHTANQILLLTKDLMRNLVNLINNLLDNIGFEVNRSKKA